MYRLALVDILLRVNIVIIPVHSVANVLLQRVVDVEVIALGRCLDGQSYVVL